MKKKWFLYIAYLLYFLGIGLQSGSIVHLIVNPQLYIILYFIGVILFGIGAFLQKIENTTHSTTKELFKYIVFSSLFSMGIGLISGSIQHFSDIGVLASIYIPVGMVLSSIFYFKKEKHHLNIGHILVFILAILIGFILYPFTGDKIPSHGHDANIETHVENSQEIKKVTEIPPQEVEEKSEKVISEKIVTKNINDSHDDSGYHDK